MRPCAAGLPFAALTLLASTNASAQSTFPERPVRIIVNFATGGPSDIVARIVSAKLTESWGKSVVVENIAGGGGNIGVERAIKATPDGYTLLLSGSSPIVINPSLLDKPSFDPVRELAPVKQGVWAPAKTTGARVRRIQQDLRALIALPDVRARFFELGMEPTGTTEAELAQVIQSDLAKWARVIKASGVRAEWHLSFPT